MSNNNKHLKQSNIARGQSSTGLGLGLPFSSSCYAANFTNKEMHGSISPPSSSLPNKGLLNSMSNSNISIPKELYRANPGLSRTISGANSALMHSSSNNSSNSSHSHHHNSHLHHSKISPPLNQSGHRESDPTKHPTLFADFMEKMYSIKYNNDNRNRSDSVANTLNTHIDIESPQVWNSHPLMDDHISENKSLYQKYSLKLPNKLDNEYLAYHFNSQIMLLRITNLIGIVAVTYGFTKRAIFMLIAIRILCFNLFAFSIFLSFLKSRAFYRRSYHPLFIFSFTTYFITILLEHETTTTTFILFLYSVTFLCLYALGCLLFQWMVLCNLMHATCFIIFLFLQSHLDNVNTISFIFYILAVFLMGSSHLYVLEKSRKESFVDSKRLQRKAESLREEKEKSEQLLSNILPDFVIKMMNKEWITRKCTHAISRDFPDCSILYCDIVEFTSLASGVEPEQLVKLLNEVFTEFDRVVEEHGCEKIKTDGDAYVCAGGLTIQHEQHYKAIIDIAIDIVNLQVLKKNCLNRELKLRVGCATGSVIGGVIGCDKFQFDVWGEAIAIAHTLEQTGKPGKIHVVQRGLEKLNVDDKSKYEIQQNLDSSFSTPSYFIIPLPIPTPALESPLSGAEKPPSPLQENETSTTSTTSNNQDDIIQAEIDIIQESDQPKMNSKESDPIEMDTFKSSTSSTSTTINNNNNTCSTSSSSTITSSSLNQIYVQENDEISEQDFIDASKPESIESKKKRKEDNKRVKHIYNMFVKPINQGRNKIKSKTREGNELAKIRIDDGDPLQKNGNQEQLSEVDRDFRGYTNINKIIIQFTNMFVEGQFHKYVITNTLFETKFFIGVGILLHLVFFIDDLVLKSQPLFNSNFIYLIMGVVFALYFGMSFSKILRRPIVYQIVFFLLLLMFGICTTLELLRYDNPLARSSLTRVAATLFFVNVFHSLNLICVTFLNLFIFAFFFICASLISPNLTQHIFVTDYVGIIIVLLIQLCASYGMKLGMRRAWIIKTKVRFKGMILQKEREKSAKLLENILPITISEKLMGEGRGKGNSMLIAQKYSHVAIMFINIVGFENMKGSMEASTMVANMNHIFSIFDSLLKTYELEKIKTIGTAYMVVAGLNDQSNQHPRTFLYRVADMALTAKSIVMHVSNNILDVQVGISFGPCVAGCIGIQRAKFDVWGDTANISSRMQTSADHGRIQVTKEVAKILRKGFFLDERGPIPVKGKGVMTTFYLTGRKGSSDNLSSECDLDLPKHWRQERNLQFSGSYSSSMRDDDSNVLKK